MSIEHLGQIGRKQRYYRYAAIADCCRHRVLRMYPRSGQHTAISVSAQVLSKLPFPDDRVQADNGQGSAQPPAST